MPLTDKLKTWSNPPAATPTPDAPAPAAATPAPAAPATPAQSSAPPASFGPPPSDNPLGQTGLLEKPSDVSYQDWLMAKMAEASKGFTQMGSAADDFVRAKTDYMTGGLMDRGAAAMNSATGLGGGDLAQQRAQTQQAHSNLGGLDAAAFAGGYGSSFGRLNPVLGLGAYEGVKSAQEGTDPTSARIMTDPMGVGLNALGGAAEGGVLGLAGKGLGAGYRYLTSGDPAKVILPRGNYDSGLGFSPGAGYPTNGMSAEDVARFAREVTGIKQAGDVAGGNTMIDVLNRALARSTPEQVAATRQAYQGMGGDVTGGTPEAPSLARRVANWAATGLGGALGGAIGHQTGLPEARAGGVALGGYLGNQIAKGLTKPPPGVYPALSGGPPPTGLEAPVTTFGSYYGSPALKHLLGLGGATP